MVVTGQIDWRRLRTVAAWILLTGSLLGWPISMLTWARDEPPFVLGLSWLAIVIESASLLTGSQIHESQDDDAGPARR